MPSPKKLLVVTDLDATLLDHDYSWAAAEPALTGLRERGWPLVLNSSKTLAEMEALVRALALDTPIVAENGGLVALPDASERGYEIDIRGLPRQTILTAAHRLRRGAGYKFKGFADWSTAELSALTGLSPEQAEASADRLATEPICWEDSEENRLHFAQTLAGQGIRMLRGGRFWHLMGEADKAGGVAAVRAFFEKREPDTRWQVVALGDSANDQAMLEAADIAVVIPHAEGPRIDPRATRVIHAPSPATAGWNAAVSALLNEF
jgi:mannosyl-3-phosphoglycerate phosphatase